MACSMNNSVDCLPGWSPCAGAMAEILCWVTSWAWMCIPWLAVDNNFWSRMSSAVEPDAWVVVVLRRKKNARHNRRSPLPPGTRYRWRSYDRITLVASHYDHYRPRVGPTLHCDLPQYRRPPAP